MYLEVDSMRQKVNDEFSEAGGATVRPEQQINDVRHRRRVPSPM